MEVGAAVGAGIVVVVIASALVRRRRSSEAQSVAGYRQTLDVLGHLGDERRVRRHGPPDRDLPSAVTDERSRSAPPANFDDVGAGNAHRRSTKALGGAPARRDRSLLVMERPARRLGAPLAALVLVLAAGAAAYVVVRAHHVTHPPKRSASSEARRHAHTPPSSSSSTSTSTTAPPRYTAVSSTGSSATYAPATSSYSLSVGATTADCWISVTSASGATVLAQTFTPGASVSLSLTGRSTIVLGAPRAAELSIDGVPVVLPGGLSGPFTVVLSPA